MRNISRGYVIEDGVNLEALKEAELNKAKKTKYPWDFLEVGQSFFIDKYPSVQQMKQAAKNRSKINDHGYEYEAVTDGEGVRVFRTK